MRIKVYLYTNRSYSLDDFDLWSVDFVENIFDHSYEIGKYNSDSLVTTFMWFNMTSIGDDSITATSPSVCLFDQILQILVPPLQSNAINQSSSNHRQTLQPLSLRITDVTPRQWRNCRVRLLQFVEATVRNFTFISTRMYSSDVLKYGNVKSTEWPILNGPYRMASKRTVSRKPSEQFELRHVCMSGHVRDNQ